MQRRGGISRLYTEVLPRLLTMDPDLEVVLYLRRKLKGGALPNAPRLDYLHEGSISPWHWIYGKRRAQAQLLSRAYRRTSCDLFQGTYFSLPITLRTPYVVTVYDTMDEIYAENISSKEHNRLLRLKSRCIQSADLIFSISHSTTADIVRFHRVDPAKIVTVHLGVSLQFRVVRDERLKQVFLQRFGLGRPFFLYVGNRAGVKNFQRLLHAYVYSNCGADIDLVTVGGEPAFTEQELLIIREHQLEHSVKHLPDLDDENLAIAYNLALAFLYPSSYEGFGLPVLEAMACGAPVIASKVASIPEVAGEAALYVHPEEIGEIAAALCQVRQEDCRKALVRAGLRQAERFSWDDTARTMLDAYRKIL